MNNNDKAAPILRYNPQTGFYEGYLRVQVDSEIFRRQLIRTVEEDPAADLTDPNTWTQAIAKAGKITNWLDRPHVTLTPIATSHAQASIEQQSPIAKPVTKAMLLEERLRKKAQSVAPYKWDTECLTPIGDHSLSPSVREDIGRLRYDERQVLKRLRTEWEAGTYTLDPQAAALQAEHERQEQSRVTTKIETVATAVNGARLR